MKTQILHYYFLTPNQPLTLSLSPAGRGEGEDAVKEVSIPQQSWGLYDCWPLKGA